MARLLDAHPAEAAGHPGLVELLSSVVADGPALPAAGGAMAALARLCLEPGPRARVRAEANLAPVVRRAAPRRLAAQPAALAARVAAGGRLPGARATPVIHHKWSRY